MPVKPDKSLEGLLADYQFQRARHKKALQARGEPVDPTVSLDKLLHDLAIMHVEAMRLVSESSNSPMQSEKVAENVATERSDIECVAEYKRAHPQASVRKISEATGIKRTKVWTLLKQVEALLPNACMSMKR